MDLNGIEDEDIVPKIDKEEKKKEQKKPIRTKEEIANFWKEYYDWLKSIYPLESFEIQGRDGEILYFHSNYNLYNDKDKPQNLIYRLRDGEFKEVEAKRVKLNLSGEKAEIDKEYETKAAIIIDKENKKFSFAVHYECEENGYGRAIYNNYLHILDMLGIEDREQYELQVAQNPEHEFLKNMHTEELVARTNSELNTENALQIIEEFAKYPNTMSFSQFNTIIEYALNSNVAMEKIAEAINDNGFNIGYSTVNGVPYFEEKDFEKFKSFGITGLKATCMHNHFMKNKNFGFMKLLGDVDTQDATLEFKRVFEEVKNKYKKRVEEDKHIPHNLRQFGELEHIILDWKHSGLLFRNVDSEIKSIVKEQAISKFEEFDPEHKEEWELRTLDYNSDRTFRMLKDAGLMDKEAYIALYQKALNRNYNLEEFDNVIYRFISKEERKAAREEIARNAYYPSPKKSWQKSYARAWKKEHKISKVEIPQSLAKKEKVRDILKQEIIAQGVARRTKIKTDMTGIGKDNKPFVVDNLKDWLFGVPGAHGNLQMMGTSAIAFPPQTPEFAVEMVKGVLNDLAYPGIGGRDD